MSFEPRAADSYTVTVDIPQGDIYSQRFPACPSISIDKQNPTGKTIMMQNRQATPMDVSVFIRGCSTINYPQIRIEPNTVYHLFVPACASQILNGQQDASIYYWTGNSVVNAPCGGQTYDVSTDYAQQIQSPYSLVDTGYVRRSDVEAVDATNLALSRTMQSVTQYMTSLALAQLQMFIDMGIPINASTLNNFERVLLPTGLSPEAIANITNQYKDQYNITKDLAGYEASLAQLQQESDAAAAATAAAMAAARQAIGASGNTLGLLDEAGRRLNQATLDSAEARINLIETQQNVSRLMAKTLKDIVNDLSSEDSSNLFSSLLGGMFGLIGSCIHGGGVCGDVANFIGRVADDVMDLIELPFKIFGGITDFFFTLIISGVVSVVVSVSVFKCMMSGRGRSDPSYVNLYKAPAGPEAHNYNT
jgi:hypothetical protein